MGGLTAEQRELLDRVTAKHGLLPGIAETAPATPTKAVRVEVGEVSLTDRQVEVLALIADGYTNQEIAETLLITIETVKTHTRRTLAALGCVSRAHAAAEGVRRGLIE